MADYKTPADLTEYIKGMQTRLSTLERTITGSQLILGASGNQPIDVSVGSGYTEIRPVQYSRDAAGMVHLHGQAEFTASGSPGVMFNLPAGFRPRVGGMLVPAAIDLYNGQLAISDTGDVFIGTHNNAGGLQTVYLDGINFRAVVNP